MLYRACEKGNVDVVKLLLSMNVFENDKFFKLPDRKTYCLITLQQGIF